MAKRNLINPRFPFTNSVDGFFVDMTKTNNSAIKSDLIHLITTKKGERYYLPEFGTNLMRFIFEPNDGLTETGIVDELKTAVNRFIPNLQVDSVSIDRDVKLPYTVKVKIEYTITEDVFESSDSVTFNI